MNSAHSSLKLDFDQLRSRLRLKHIQSENLLTSHHSQAVAFLSGAGVSPGGIRRHAAKLLAAGATAGSLLFSPLQAYPAVAALPDTSQNDPVSASSLHSQTLDLLHRVLPGEIHSLPSESTSQISDFLHQKFGLHAQPELEGNRLNTDYGIIGAEQHLPRFPGDSVWEHGSHPESGMTPGRGAWGYFAQNRHELTPQMVTREKYYVAVQTLYLPDWSTRLPYLRDWYQYRKVVLLNPQNGKVLVADIADSGPSYWTGKQFGGSPEVMDYLEAKDGHQKGPVVLFFVDDPDDSVPLGPLDYNLEHPTYLPTPG
jgi:hypothetical protein